MRKMILAAMLVTVAAPAMAQDQDGWAARRAERQQQREQRGEAPRGEARQQQPQEVRQPHVEQQQQEQRVEPQRAERAQEWRRVEQQARPERQARPEQQDRPEQPRVRWSQPAPQAQAPVVQADGVTVRRGEQGGDRRRWEGQRDAPRSGAWQQQRQQRGGWQQQPQQRNPQYSGQWQQQPPRRDEQQRDGQHWTGQNNGQRWAGHNDGQRWSSQWRNDNRYDWQRYRARNQSIFRIGRYNDPFGWGYRRPSIGITLYAGYYQPDSWLDDPWQYRLPPVYGPYRWVRYYDDALLVDIYSGQVVDVIDNFFW